LVDRPLDAVVAAGRRLVLDADATVPRRAHREQGPHHDDGERRGVGRELGNDQVEVRRRRAELICTWPDPGWLIQVE